MADPVFSTDPLERYGAIERAYCEERWTSVIHDGQALLGDLSRVDEAPREGLKERLQLIIAHAFLYGLCERDSAEDLYLAVLHSEAEASLRQIAEQGLQQCSLPTAASDWQDPQSEEEPSSGLASAPTAETSVWHQAPDPELRAASASPLPASEEGAASWPSAEATSGLQDSAALPVMPWLEAGAAQVDALSTPSGSGQVIAVEESGGLPDPQEPASESLPPQESQAPRPLAAVPIQAATSPDPSLAVGESSAAEERLLADVVEEPELIELYQSDSFRRDEVVIQMRTDRFAAPSVAEVTKEAAALADLELLGAVQPPGPGSDSRISDLLDRSAEDPPQPVRLRPWAPRSATPRVQVTSGMRPFSGPPQPVAEEDPELLMGLLKVEMG